MPDLAWWLQNFERSAVRLETLPAYDSPRETEMLVAFLRGKEVRLPDDFAWLHTVERHKAAGRTMQRVRVVNRPLSDYLRFEMSLYPQCVQAGEEIRITEDQQMASLGDYWVFDRTTIILLHYDALGRFNGQSPAHDRMYIDHADRALATSMELSAYTSRAARQ